MAEREAPARQLALERGGAHPRLDAHRQRLPIEPHAAPLAGACRARRPPRARRAAAPRRPRRSCPRRRAPPRGSGSRTPPAPPAAARGCPGRGRRRELPRARRRAAHEVRVPLAGRVRHPIGVIGANPAVLAVAVAERRAQRPGRVGGERRRLQAHLPERHRRAGLGGDAHALAQELQRLLSQRRGPRRVPPSPPAHGRRVRATPRLLVSHRPRPACPR